MVSARINRYASQSDFLPAKKYARKIGPATAWSMHTFFKTVEMFAIGSTRSKYLYQ